MSHLLAEHGFTQKPSPGDLNCADCDAEVPAGKQSWWVRTSYEYDEWECYCRRCAFDFTRRYRGPWPGDRLPRKPLTHHWPLNIKKVPMP